MFSKIYKSILFRLSGIDERIVKLDNVSIDTLENIFLKKVKTFFTKKRHIIKPKNKQRGSGGTHPHITRVYAPGAMIYSEELYNAVFDHIGEYFEDALYIDDNNKIKFKNYATIRQEYDEYCELHRKRWKDTKKGSPEQVSLLDEQVLFPPKIIQKRGYLTKQSKFEGVKNKTFDMRKNTKHKL